MKFIFVTGGVVSGLGKGITAASLGRLLKSRGFKVISQKLDPYINVDPGTMSPYQHGEVFVLAMKFGEGIRVNAIAPGFLLTNQNRTLLTNPDGSLTDRSHSILGHTPFGRFLEQIGRASCRERV